MNTRYALILITLLSTFDLFGQEKIDDNVSIIFPTKPEVKEFSENAGGTQVNLKAFYLNTDEQSLIATRTAWIENDKESNKSASSTTELKKIYDSDIKFQILAMKKKGLIFSDSSRINIQNNLAFRLRYTLINTEEPGAESIILFFNGIRYVFTYSKVNTFIEEEKDKFLNSISLTNLKNASQIESTEITEPNWFTVGQYAGLLIVLILFFRKASKSQSKYGINLKAVYCPNCNTKQPFLRFPKSSSQALYGGTTCPKCGTELDKYGNIV